MRDQVLQWAVLNLRESGLIFELCSENGAVSL